MRETQKMCSVGGARRTGLKITALEQLAKK